MDVLDRLHPALAYHVVNTLGWPRLLPLQEAALAPLAGGEHALLLAPTAGGKTEAAAFPVLSRMLAEDWRGLSVLYVCPIKALLNNLEPRLGRYAELLGRRVALWHGDVGDAARRRIVREPPDLLLTTPESIEVLLVSRRADPRAFFAGVRAVIVDEIHAFAGDDRGWHLLSVLGRVEKMARAPVQRIGLSATVGNSEALLEWLAGASPGPRRVIRAPSAAGPASAEPDVQLDYVGHLDNAALVVSRLHRGEKRLVFCDSRSRVEKLAVALRQAGVTTYVSHSSLSRDERHRAERAFAEDRDCVIVATSTLELGIDVGDLDRVIQIDAPPTVASLLQRMGRTGRRAGARPNVLLLATSGEALAAAAGLVELWRAGYVEPVEPPRRPLHVFAQQLMALALQEGGVGAGDWRGWLASLPPFAELRPAELAEVVEHMLARGILFADEGVLWFGVEGERAFGRRHFMEVLSVITSPPRFLVLYGREELGTVDQATLLFAQTPRGLLLSGRTWDVRRIDWRRRRLYVEPAKQLGRSLWLGEGRPMRFEHAQVIRRLLADDAMPPGLSRRARERLEELRTDYPWLEDGGEEMRETVLALDAGKGVSWWTFAGLLANAALADGVRETTDVPIRAENLSITFQTEELPSRVAELVEAVRRRDAGSLRTRISDKAIEGLKFSACLPAATAVTLLAERAHDERALRAVLGASLRVVD